MSTLVTITGIDGAGKSTLAKRVVRKLEANGHSATYVYGRYLPRLAYPLMEFGRRTLFSETDIETDYSTHHNSKREFFSKLPVSRLYEFLLMVDYAPQLVYRLLPALATSDYVICDRYVFDTFLTDLAGSVITSPEDATERYRSYSRVVPTPDYMFHVQIPIDVAFRRKEDTPALEYLEKRKAFYDAFTTAFDMVQLDGTDELESLEADILDIIL